ncbi:MAG: hypothetical protein OEY93_00650 [Anaerolineae bacterium]|nr:hypothetical protein [Anaerolineae bacterium]
MTETPTQRLNILLAMAVVLSACQAATPEPAPSPTAAATQPPTSTAPVTPSPTRTEIPRPTRPPSATPDLSLDQLTQEWQPLIQIIKEIDRGCTFIHDFLIDVEPGDRSKAEMDLDIYLSLGFFNNAAETLEDITSTENTKSFLTSAKEVNQNYISLLKKLENRIISMSYFKTIWPADCAPSKTLVRNIEKAALEAGYSEPDLNSLDG